MPPNVLQSVASTSGRNFDSTRRRGRHHEPDADAHDDELQTLAENQPEHVSRLCTECDADANLAHA
jgi:hypothetical protein